MLVGLTSRLSSALTIAIATWSVLLVVVSSFQIVRGPSAITSQQSQFTSRHKNTQLRSRVHNNDGPDNAQQLAMSMLPSVSTRSASSSRLFRRFNKNAVKALQSTASSTSADTSSPSAMPEEADVSSAQLGAWVPLGSASSLAYLGPQKITIMNIDFVVWHQTPADPKTPAEELVWSVQADACAHRLAPLSQGRVNPETQCIECPYHGWTFDKDGTLTSIPQLEAEKPLPSQKKANVPSFSVHLAGDLMFVFLPTSIHGESFPKSLLPEDYYPYLKDCMEKETTYYSKELPYSFDLLVENFMDPAHIPFAHHSLQGTRDDAMPIDTKLLVSNHTHVELSFKDVTRAKPREGIMSFQRPFRYHFRIKKNETGTYEPNLIIYTIPVKAGKCRVIFRDFKLPLPLPKFLLHLGSNQFLNSDIWLHDVERYCIQRKEQQEKEGKKSASSKFGLDYLYPTQSDLGVIAYRKWWAEHGFADSPAHTFSMATMDLLGPTTLTRREQIDPWESHTKHCSSCRKALGMLKKGQSLCLAFALLSVVLGVSGSASLSSTSAGIGRKVIKPLLALIGGSGALYGRNIMKKLATALEGNPYAGEIEDRSVAALK